MSTMLIEKNEAATSDVELAGGLPNGDELANEMLLGLGRKATAKLKRETRSKGSRVQYQPQGWTLGGNVD